MKKSFPSYYRPDQNELKELWSECTFIFDTNVLLDLHRYSKRTCEEFLSLLEKIAPRIWIPHQVALEYQENRLTVIAEQEHRYERATQILDESLSALEERLSQLGLKKSHSPIDPRPMIEKAKIVLDEFRTELENLVREQPTVSDEDTIRKQLDVVLDGRIGSPPSSQEELDKIYEEGSVRYEKRIPPGYKDRASKGKPEKEESEKKENFFYNGLLYKREFGDLIIWFQLIKELTERQNCCHVILVTSDNKEDWWWKFNGKVIGPRHELVEEIRSKTSIDLFYMYNAEKFLVYAREYLEAEVSQESIDQVRDVMQQRLPNRFLTIFTKSHQATEYIYNQLKEEYPEDDVVYQDFGFPDIVHTSNQTGLRRGYETKLLSTAKNTLNVIRDFTGRAYEELYRKRLDELTLILIIEDPELRERARRIFETKFKPEDLDHIFIRYALARFDNDNRLLELQIQ